MPGSRFLGSASAAAGGALAASGRSCRAAPARRTSRRAPDAALVSRGEYLARAGDCIACHTAPEGKLFAGGRAMPTPFGTLYTSNITPDPETGIGKWTADQFYAMMHTGRFPDGGLLYPAMPFASYTKVTRAGQRRDLRLPADRRAGPAGEPAARSALSLQQPLADPRLAHAVLHRRRVQAGPEQVGGMEPGRLPGRGPRPLRHVPHADQRAGRQLGVGGLQGRPDPDAELVRPFPDLEQGGGPRRLEHQGHHRPAQDRDLRRAARSTGRWPRWSTTACNT